MSHRGRLREPRYYDPETDEPRGLLEPLSIDFDRVVSSVYPSSDHQPLPAEPDAALLAFETELHNQHLEDLFREDFDIELPRPPPAASPARKRTFDGRLKPPTSSVIELD